jgi:hypothetical protein
MLSLLASGLPVSKRLTFKLLFKNIILIAMTVEKHGFGEHVWEIDVNMISQLLFWCKTTSLVSFIQRSNFISLPLRSALHHNNHPNQGLGSHLLPTSLPHTILPNTMLVRDDILRHQRVCLPHCNNIPMSSSIIRLE